MSIITERSNNLNNEVECEYGYDMRTNQKDMSVLPIHPDKIKSMNDILCILRGGNQYEESSGAGGGGEGGYPGDYSEDDDQDYYYEQQQQQPPQQHHPRGGPPYDDRRMHPGMGYSNNNMHPGPGGSNNQNPNEMYNQHQQQQQHANPYNDNYQGYPQGSGNSNPNSNGNPYNQRNQPELPGEPSLPDDDEPPLPGSPYGQGSPYPPPSLPGQRGGRPPPQQYQQQQQQQYRQQQQQQQPLPRFNDDSTDSPQELELESFDKNLIFAGLKRMYRKKILPLELSSKYGHFHSPPLSPSDFEAKPMVLLLGQYSVGKTSFIRYLLGRDFPGIRIGPEPTTDRFNCIMEGDIDKVIPGAALCSQADRPFRGLSPFGNNFLCKLEGVEMDAPILHNITLVDTPGILSGVKQSAGRNYDYDAVMKWFAERADLIIIMFDAHKLDISDELKRVIQLMKSHGDKVRVVLNKADSISTQQLMRVYGALMWQLGKVMDTPEVCRVYIGSFWGAPLKNTEQAVLLNQEKLDLFSDIAQLPQNAVMRRINELVKRARSVKVHAYIIHYLRKQLPYTFGKREKQARLIGRLDRELVMCARRYELPRGDFPPVDRLREALLEIKDLSEFPKLDKRLVKDMDKVFSVDIPELLEKARAD